jgi:hypothetical protein
MSTRFWHISDADLTAHLDGELSKWKRARVDRHLPSCSFCGARRSELAGAASAFSAAKSASRQTNAELTVTALRARLQDAAAQEERWHLKPILSTLVPATITLGLLLSGYLMIQRTQSATTPDAELTPGVARAAGRDEICTVASDEEFYPIPATVALRVFETYGIRNPEPRSYEVDYLITPSLGGADDIRNLWPQPYEGGEWNAHVKDALEDHLYTLVCNGEVALEKAQRDIATNWIAAYKQYFQTEAPLTAHRAFLKDPPWPHASR